MNGETPSGTASEDEETVYEFTATAQSGKDALGKGLKAAQAGLKTGMAVRRAKEHREQINRQARRAKTKDVLQIFGILTSFF